MGWFARGVALGLVIGSAIVARAGWEAPAPQAKATEPPAVKPARHDVGPDESRREPRELERPGREDPEQFYKKPPRKPKLKTRMHA